MVILRAIYAALYGIAFELSLEGRYDFLDGVIIPHTCDAIERLYDIWRYYQKSTATHFLNVPHIIHQRVIFVFPMRSYFAL